jgi:hypothetical protein
VVNLNEKRVELINLPVTIKALEQFDYLIKYYGVDKPGPAYCVFKHIDGPGEIDCQVNRNIMVECLSKQRDILVNYLNELGIEV